MLSPFLIGMLRAHWVWSLPSAGSIMCCTLVFSTFNNVLSEPYFSSPVFKMNLFILRENICNMSSMVSGLFRER